MTKLSGLKETHVSDFTDLAVTISVVVTSSGLSIPTHLLFSKDIHAR